MAKNIAKFPKQSHNQHPSQSGTRFRASISLPEQNRTRLNALLNARLADSLDFYSQAKFAHWNVKGKDFYQVHLLFDTIAEHAIEHIDLIAERITALGGVAHGTVRMSAAASSLPEYDTQALGSMEHVRALASALSQQANAIRDAIDQAEGLHDKVTADLFTQIGRELDKDLYFLEAHLQDKGEKNA